MKNRKIKRTVMFLLLIVGITLQAGAQSKEVDKGNEMLKKAMTQTDAYKRQDLISKAREQFMKGGLKSQEVNVLIGDAYLEKGDLINAANSYSSATKEDKKIGLKKVAEAYVDQAFAGDDEKAREKNLKKAMQLFGKSGDEKEGARLIGDRYYEQGFDSYDKALEYYIAGEATVKVEQIATAYKEKGGDNEVKAAEAYLKLKTPEGYQKGGDIYYNRKEYQKAIEAYTEGGVAEGVQKYANYLYAEHRDEDADNLIVQLAEKLAEKKKDDELEKLAKEVQSKGSYGLSAKIYDKAGNVAMADKCRAYDALIGFRLEEAKSLFNSTGDTEGEKMIDDNIKVLTVLKDINDEMDQVMKGAPFVSLIKDSLTGISTPSPSDQKMMEDYYSTKSIRDQIINNVYNVSANFAKLNNDNLKKYIRIAFMKFGAIRNILNTDNFSIKKQKTEIKTKDVIL